MQYPQKQILLIDDDLDTCEMMAALLGIFNYKVSFAQTMAEGVQLAQKKSFDLCVLDGWLSDGCGFDLCRHINAINPTLPIIFYSGDATRNSRQQALAAGALAYLVKPNDLDKLEEVIHRHVNQSEPATMCLPT